MTRDEARAMAALMLAYADGKTIQYLHCGEWLDCSRPAFNSISTYRIKPEPKEIWVNEYEDYLPSCHETKQLAEISARPVAIRVAVHYREVCDE